VAELAEKRAAATVHKAHRVLSLILQHAMLDGRLIRNPATAIKLPRVQSVERIYLTHDQVERLANAVSNP
jgi:integrase